MQATSDKSQGISMAATSHEPRAAALGRGARCTAHGQGRLSQRGVTLMEMIVVIVILGVAIPPLMTLVGRVMENNLLVRSIQNGTVIGNDLMEEILSRSYDENQNPPWGPIGAEGGETRATYDDVDDFDAITNEVVAAPLGNYTVSVDVYFIDPDTVDLNTSQGTGASALDYKRVDVTVSNPFVGSQQFSTVVSRSRTL